MESLQETNDRIRKNTAALLALYAEEDRKRRARVWLWTMALSIGSALAALVWLLAG